MSSPNLMAKGNINPAVFVKIDPANSNGALQAGSGDKCIGVSTESAFSPPLTINGVAPASYAAVSGQGVTIFGAGEICALTIGTGGCSPGDMLKSDGSGNGVVTTGGEAFGAIALESGSAGARSRVQVVPYGGKL